MPGRGLRALGLARDQRPPVCEHCRSCALKAQFPRPGAYPPRATKPRREVGEGGGAGGVGEGRGVQSNGGGSSGDAAEIPVELRLWGLQARNLSKSRLSLTGLQNTLPGPHCTSSEESRGLVQGPSFIF